MPNSYVTLTSLSKNISFSSIAYFFIAIFGICRSIILTKSLGLELYGSFLIIINFVSIYFLFFNIKVNDVAYKLFATDEFTGRHGKEGVIFFIFLLSAFQAFILLIVALLIYEDIFRYFYSLDGLIVSVKLYLFAIIFMSFEGFVTAILRIDNKYISLLIPQVISFLISVLLLLFLMDSDRLNVNSAVSVYLGTIGFYVTVSMGIIVRKYLPNISSREFFISFFRKFKLFFLASRKTIVDTIFSNYLKTIFNPGDVFLLGIISNPSQVGLYGLAKTLTSPVNTIGSVLQTVFTPYIVNLVKIKNFGEIRNLLMKNMLAFLCMGLFMLSIFEFFGEHILKIFFTLEYLDSIQIAIILTLASLTHMSLGNTLYPFAVSQEDIALQNKGFIITTIIIVIGFFVFSIDAYIIAYSQLVLAFVLATIFYLPMLKKLNKKIRE
jgi:O-antigen/teichoic acid export membrane protein